MKERSYNDSSLRTDKQQYISRTRSTDQSVPGEYQGEKERDAIVELKPESYEKGTDVAIAEVLEGSPLPPGMERRLIWKADLYITFFMAFIYGIQFADKTMTSAATSLGLRQDLDMMHGSAYSWVGSGFYLGYLVFEFPMSYILHRFPIARSTAVIIVCWGIVIACAAACQGKESFLSCRVLLGVFESAVTPAFVVLTSQWYRRKEHFARTCFWFSANGVGSILASSIGYGLLDRQEKHGLALSGWRVFYIIMGLVTIIAGVVFYFYMPNNPSEAWFLSDEEKLWQIERIRENKQGYGTTHVKWYQVREAFIDPLTWLYCATSIVGNVPNGGITTFSNLILQGMNFDDKHSLLMGLPSGGAEVVGLAAVGIASSYIGQDYRMAWAGGGAALNMMSMCLLAWGPNKGAQLTGLYLNTPASPTAFVGLVACIESNSAGHTKKLTTNALLLICYCVGNLIGPQTFISSEQPQYPTGKVTMACTAAIQVVLDCAIVVVYYWHNQRRNKKDERLPPDLENPEFADLTDWENPEFRYAY